MPGLGRVVAFQEDETSLWKGWVLKQEILNVWSPPVLWNHLHPGGYETSTHHASHASVWSPLHPAAPSPDFCCPQGTQKCHRKEGFGGCLRPRFTETAKASLQESVPKQNQTENHNRKRCYIEKTVQTIIILIIWLLNNDEMCQLIWLF